MRPPWIALALLPVPAVALAVLLGLEPGLSLPIRGARFILAAWGLGALGGALYAGGRFLRGHETDWRRGLGMALMLFPLATTLQGILNDLGPLIAGGRTITARTPYQLSTIYLRSILLNLGYLGAGFLLWSGWRSAWSLRDLAARLRATGFPMGRRSEGASMTLGVAWFPVLLLGAFVVEAIVSGTALVNNDETSVWSRVTPWHTLMISLAAAVGEEAVYRGFLMVALANLLRPFLPGEGRLPAHWAVAIALQAIIFGFAHAGFGNYAHVLQATLFGLVAGLGAYFVGIWAVIVLHFLVDIFAIGQYSPTPGMGTILWVLLAANVVYTIVAAGQWARRRRPHAA